MDAVDVGLVDVDLDLERGHVDDRADAGAGEAAAGGDGGDHLARLCVLRDDDAVERCADDQVLDILPLQVDLPLRGRELVALRVEPCPGGVELGAGAIEVGAAGDLSRRQPLRALVVELRLADAHPRLLQRAPRRRGLGLGQGEAARGIGGIEPGQHLPRFHLQAFLHEDLRHLARDLRGDRGLPARRDVAAGIEHRTSAAAAGDHARLRDLDLCRGAAEEHPGHDGQQEHDRSGDPDRTPSRARFVRAVNA